MKAQTSVRQGISGVGRLAQVFFVAALGLGLLCWSLQGQPVKGDAGRIYVRPDGDDHLCTGETDAAVTAAPACAVKTIAQGIYLVTAGGEVIVRPGVYTESIVISKPLTLMATGLVTLTAAASDANATLIKVTADHVTVDGFSLLLNRPHAVAGIVAGAVTAEDTHDVHALTVRNCIIQDSLEIAPGIGMGTFDNRYNLPTNAVGIAVLSADQANIESLTLSNNRITLNSCLEFGTFTLLMGGLTRGVWLREVYGEVSNNTIAGLAHDALIQFAYGGATTLRDNHFRGAGVEIAEPHSGPIVIESNTFAPWTPDFARSLLIKHNYRPLGNPTPVAINIVSNTFTGHTVGILSAASRGVTIHNNVFIPPDAATVFTHTQVNTAYPTDGAQSPLGGANSIIFTNNTFWESGAGGLNGTAIEIRNDYSKGAVDFDSILIGGASSAANTFRRGLARTVWLAENVASTNPAIHAYWNAWGYGTIHDIEATLQHQADDSALAKINFYTIRLEAAPTTQWADGVSAIQATAAITGFLTPGSGNGVAFAASSGTIAPALDTTDAAGQARAALTSNFVGPARITATAGITVNHPVSAAVSVTFIPNIDLMLTKSDGGGPASPGNTLSYRLTYTNTSAHQASQVIITESVPLHTTFNQAASTAGWTCPDGAYAGSLCTYPIGTLDASAVHSVTFAVNVVYPFPAGETWIINTATIADIAIGADPTPWNNSHTLTTTVDAAPYLEIGKDDLRLTVRPGETLAYVITITNTGNQDAAGIRVTDTLPAGVAFGLASNNGEEVEPGLVVWPAFNLSGGGGKTSRILIATVDTPLPAAVAALTNTATLCDSRGFTAAALDVDAVDARPALVLAKSAAVTTTVPGALLTYTLTLTNTGNQAAVGVRLTDTLPAAVTFVAASHAGTESAPGHVTWPAFDLPGGLSVSRVLTVAVKPTLPAGVEWLINAAQAADQQGDAATAQHATFVTATPALALAKSDDRLVVGPGQTLTYRLVITNTGNRTATGVRLSDALPAEVAFVAASHGGNQTAPGFVAWPAFDLPGGASTTRFLTVTVRTPFPSAANAITNTATVGDEAANTATAADTDIVDAAPAWQLTKDDGQSTAAPGATLIYRLTITNTGNQLATGVTLTDTLPAHTTFVLASDGGSQPTPGVVVWPPFDLPGGASATRLLIVTVNTPLPAAVATLTNTATLCDARGFTAAALDVDAVDARPALVLAKSAAVTTTVPGALLTYTLTLTNTGNQAAVGVRLTDTLPAAVTFVAASHAGTESAPGHVTWPAFDLPGGLSVSRVLTVAVKPTLPAGVELLVNTARADAARSYTAMTQHALRVVAAPDLVITKTDHGIAPRPGEILLYTLAYTNAGVQEATGVVIAETVPAHTAFDTAVSSPGWMCAHNAPAGTPCTYAVGALPAHASGVITFGVRVVNPLPVGVSQTENTVSIRDDGENGADPDLSNNAANLTTQLAGTIDLVIGKNDGGVTVEPGETLIYTLTYANNGDQIAGSAVITESVPAFTTFNQTASSPGWTCAHGAPAGTPCIYPLGDLSRSGTRIFAVDIVLPFPVNTTEITNQVSIGAAANNKADVNPGNNTATTTTPVLTRPDLSISKSDGFSVVLPEQQLTYVITVANAGTQNATNVQITDSLPANVTFIGASDGGVQTAPGVVMWPCSAQVSLHETLTRTLTVRVNNTLPAGVDRITNTVTVSDDGAHGPDLNSADNTAIDVNIVGAMPDLVLHKTVDRAVVHPNGLLVYTIRVENTGSQGATGVRLVDTLPPEARFVGASNGGSASASGIVTWPPFTLNVGEQATRTLTARAASGLPEGLVFTNTATVSDDGANGADPLPENNTAVVASRIQWPVIYLPLAQRSYAVGPDLVVDSVVIANSDLAITVRNQGELPVTTAIGFWVDLYINPSPAPTQVNQTWDLIAAYGAVWGVDREALPIPPGATRTIRLYDIYYKPTYSRLPAALRPGDVLYVQVDSVNSQTNYGAILEDHEMAGTAYNNILRVTVDTYQPLNPPATGFHSPGTAESPRLPGRD